MTIKVSWSGYHSFLFCPMSYYINYINHIEPRELFKAMPLRRGIAFHQLVLESKRDQLDQLDPVDILKIEILAAQLQQFMTFQKTEQRYNLQLNQHVEMYGTVDCWLDNETFGDLKLTGQPNRYLNEFGTTGQLQFYFMMIPDLQVKYAYFLPIRWPETYMKRNEELGNYEIRLRSDVQKRLAYYFPLLRTEKNKIQSFGYKYYKSEFVDNIRTIREDILQVCRMIWSCTEKNQWIHNYKNCWQCNYDDICRVNTDRSGSGDLQINDEKYIIRKEIKY